MRIGGQCSGCEYFLKRAHVPTSVCTSEHRVRLCVEPKRDGLISLLYSLLALPDGFPAPANGNERCDDRNRGKQDKPGYGRPPEPTESALFTQIIAGELVFGFAVDRGGQRGDFVPERE